MKLTNKILQELLNRVKVDVDYTTGFEYEGGTWYMYAYIDNDTKELVDFLLMKNNKAVPVSDEQKEIVRLHLVSVLESEVTEEESDEHLPTVNYDYNSKTLEYC